MNVRAASLLSLALALPAMGATFAVSVGLFDSIRPVTHCASGSLYGITETLPADIPGMVGALHRNEFRNPAIGDYKTQVTSVINAKIASGRTNYSGYKIWNEPNGKWKTA